MNTPVHQAETVRSFTCLGDKCADTCCKGWGMQLSQRTIDKFTADAPELLDAVTSGEADHIMKRDEKTDYCVKFDNGWCKIHAEYGEDFLGDACHSFPRVPRKLGDEYVMSASLSCPEVVRIGVMEKVGFSLVEGEVSRLPDQIKDYAIAQLDADKALAIHQTLLSKVLEEDSAEIAMSKLRSVTGSLQSVGADTWGVAAEFYWNNAHSRLPQSEENISDPFNLLNALQGLVGASSGGKRARLTQTIDDMERSLDVTLNWETLGIETHDGSLSAYQEMQKLWQGEWSDHFNPILKHWLQAELSVAFFPFAGFGESLTDRATIIGVRFATVKLALMSACQQKGGIIGEDDTIRVIQSLARFMDHLADPTLSMQIYTETGWSREARLRSLVGDL